MSPEYRGNPCHETAKAPTIRYSALFEFKHSINSRKSLLKGIRIRSLPQFAKNVHTLLRGHLRACHGIGCIGLFKTVEDTGCLLHRLNLIALRIPLPSAPSV